MVPLLVALLAAPTTEGLTVGGLRLGQPVTSASLQATHPDATCEVSPGRWKACSLRLVFEGHPVAVHLAIQPDGRLHAIEFLLPAGTLPDPDAVFGKQYGDKLEIHRQGQLRYFGVMQQTALGVFPRTHGTLYVTYTWLQGSWKSGGASP